MSKLFNYKSVLAPYMNELLAVKKSCGQHTLHYQGILNEIDKFYCETGITTVWITNGIIEEWRKTRINDRPSTLCKKYSVWRLLARYMSRQGIACFIPKPPKHSQSKDGFSPYIFTHRQIADIFEKSLDIRLINRNKQTALICVPSVLRLLYSTGLRISEAMSIRNEDVKFDKGYILIRKSKNGTERIVPIHDSLREVLLQYKSFRDIVPIEGINESDYWFFIHTNGAACSGSAVRWWFRSLLEQCSIPYLGDHRGPRVHDLRHTFAVHSLMQMACSGIDLYTSLPILSTCLGHKSVAATEKYVRLTSEMYPDIVVQCSKSSHFVYPKVEKPL